jgi:DNA invertase Pin-like site-specific DNA recombinase
LARNSSAAPIRSSTATLGYRAITGATMRTISPVAMPRLVVWKLDRLGTSIKDMTVTMLFLEEEGIGLQSLTDSIDTTTRGGTQVFRIFRALRALMRERTKTGRRVARTKGRKGGRRKLLTPSEIQELHARYNNKAVSLAEICQQFNISRATLFRYVKHRDPEKPHLKGLFRQLTGRR